MSANEPPRIAGPVPHPSRPRVAPPPGAWDTHAHIFGPSDKFPYQPGRGYTPPDAPANASSRYLIISASPMGSSCKATRMSTTTAWCLTR